MATITNPLEEYELCNLLIVVNDASQGAHHEAQKSTNTTFPEVLGIFAPGRSSPSFGRSCPTDGAADKMAVEQARSAAAMMVFILVIWFGLSFGERDYAGLTWRLIKFLVASIPVSVWMQASRSLAQLAKRRPSFRPRMNRLVL